MTCLETTVPLVKGAGRLFWKSFFFAKSLLWPGSEIMWTKGANARDKLKERNVIQQRLSFNKCIMSKLTKDAGRKTCCQVNFSQKKITLQKNRKTSK